MDTPVDGPLEMLSEIMERKASKVLEDIQTDAVPAEQVRSLALSAVKALHDFQGMVQDQAHTVLIKYTSRADGDDGDDGDEVGEMSMSFPAQEERIDLVKGLYKALGAYLQNYSQDKAGRSESSTAGESVKEEMNSASRGILGANSIPLRIGNIPNVRAKDLVRDIYEALYKHIPQPDKLDKSVMDNILTRAYAITPGDSIKALRASLDPLVEILKGSLST
jgi:hypothetical protein